MIQLLIVGIVAASVMMAGPDNKALQIQADVATQSRAQNSDLKFADAALTPAELDAKYPAATFQETVTAKAINDKSVAEGRLLDESEQEEIADGVRVVDTSNLYWKGEK